jgi:hypothetical protein
MEVHMDFYHGSTVAGLNELRPFSSPYSNLEEPLVYLTTSKQLALHYIWNTEKIATKMPMLKIGQDGVLVFQEMFSGALEYFYKGLSGFIYHCVGDYKPNRDVGVFTCATSTEPVVVHDVEHIHDVYEHIMEYGQYGTFIYEKYENLPQYRYDIIRGHVMRAIKSENMLNDSNHPLYGFYREKYPKYWEEAFVLMKHGLL